MPLLVKQYGEGSDAYFCLHGWSGDHRTFNPLLPYLPSTATLYSVDMPGCGSSAPPAVWSFGAVAEEIARAISRVPGPVTLVGNCIGALLGLRAALIDPASIRRFVLIDAFSHWPWYFEIFTRPAIGKFAYLATFANPIGRWFTDRALASRRTEASNLTSGFARADHESALHYLSILRELKSPALFGELQVPVDIVFGARTFDAVRQSAAEWRRMWPWAKVWELPDAGHLLLTEDPSGVSRIIFSGGACEHVSVTTSNSIKL